MILFILMGVFLLACVLWCLILLQKVINLSSIDETTATNQISNLTSNARDSKFFTESQLNELIPVGSSNSWQLHGVVSGHRTWHLPRGDGNHLHGMSMKVKSSSQNLMKFLGRPSLFKEWRCSVSLNSSPSDISANHRQVLRWRQKKLQCRLIGENSMIWWWLEPLLELECTVDRVFLSGAKYSGIIENNEYSHSSTAFVCQPIIGLADHFAMMRAVVDVPTPVQDAGSVGEEDGDVSEDEVTPLTSEVGEQDVESVQASGDHCSAEELTNGLHGSSNEELSSPDNVHVEDAASGDGVDAVGQLPNSKSSSANVSRQSSTASSARLIKSASMAVESATPSLSSIGKSASEDVGSRTEQVEGYNSVVFLRTTSSDEQSGLVDYKTLSNKCAADVLAEVMTATSLAVTRDRNAESGIHTGWIFDKTERDVAIMCKCSQNQNSPSSWMGKGLVKDTPDNVWHAIINPYSRYIFDEMLKDLTVISDFGNGMKLLRLYYSTNQMLRKDHREFYVLQAERFEKKKKMLTLCSVEWPDSEMKECPRGKFGACGWIIDPVVSKSKPTLSMVTYLTQIDLGDLSTSGTQQFEEEFVLKQPHAIAGLRDYLVAVK